jgi:hypothetical protein
MKSVEDEVRNSRWNIFDATIRRRHSISNIDKVETELTDTVWRRVENRIWYFVYSHISENIKQ